METPSNHPKWDEYLQNETSRPDRAVSLRIIHIDLVSDVIAGILLSQIIYWNTPSRRHSACYDSKLRRKHNGEYCLLKTQMDWWHECRITQKQYTRAIKILKDKGFVRTETIVRGGRKITAIYLNREFFAIERAKLEAKQQASEKHLLLEKNRIKMANENRNKGRAPRLSFHQTKEILLPQMPEGDIWELRQMYKRDTCPMPEGDIWELKQMYKRDT